MNSLATPNGEVFRTKIKVDRGNYFVIYQPAQVALPFATAELVFSKAFELKDVRQAMENELEHWLASYPVPVMVSASDATGDLVYVVEKIEDPY